MKEDLQIKYVHYQDLVQQLQQLQESSGALEKHIIDLSHLKDSLQNISNLSTDKESLIGLGGGIFLEGSLKDSKNVLISVGAGICVEKDINDAVKTVDKQMLEVINLSGQINLEVQKVFEDLQDVQKELQDLEVSSKN